jgi:hypothetical protein
MNIAEGVLIFVTFCGPIAAVQAQKWIERRQAKRKGKNYVFRTLMATRAARVSTEHVQALNMIDLEYYGGGPGEKAVREAWRFYLDHLNTRYDDEAAWGIRQMDLFTDLLYQMSKSLGYDFDKTQIKNSAYWPVAHGNLEHEMSQIRSGLVKILTGKATLPTSSLPATEQQGQDQNELRQLLLDFMSGRKAYPVRIVPNDGEAQPYNGGMQSMMGGNDSNK